MAPRTVRHGLPAWAISALAHAIALLALALVSLPGRRLVAPRVIASSAHTLDEPSVDDDPLEGDDADTVAGLADATAVTVSDELPGLPAVANAEADARFTAPGDVGGDTPPVADLMSRVSVVHGFAGRGSAAGLAATNGGGEDTEAAVDRALQWLATHQLPDGSWSFNFAACPRCRGACRHSGSAVVSADRAAATALALLPFLGRGHTQRHGPYTAAIERGIGFLTTRTVRQRGVAYAPTNAHGMYTQGLVGIALSECYGMTRDKRLARPAQLVIDHITTSQDSHGGGWRYGPREAGDTSALGWQVMALTSARMAYLNVTPVALARAAAFLDAVQVDAGAAYGYMDRSEPLPGRSAIGLLCRMYLGWQKDHPALLDGVSRLAAIGPTDDLYYDYYATQVLHHMEGAAWIEWNRRMKTLLLRTQATAGHEAGSWYEGVAGGFSANSVSPADIAGRLYCTSLATMILEVY